MPSFWDDEITPDYFWSTIRRLQEGIHEALFTEGPVRNVSDIIHAAHFFVAGEKVTRQITDAFEDTPDIIIHLPQGPRAR